MGKELFIDTAVAIAKKIGKSDDFKSFLCGTYSDGTPRNLPDAINDEVLSPKQKAKAKSKKKKKKKKKQKAKLKL